MRTQIQTALSDAVQNLKKEVDAGKSASSRHFPWAGRKTKKPQPGMETALITERDDDSTETLKSVHAYFYTHSHTYGKCLGPTARKSLELAENNWGEPNTHTHTRTQAQIHTPRYT